MKKQKLIILEIITGILIIGFLLGFGIGKMAKKSFNVAFYGLEESLCEPIKTKILEYNQNNKSSKIQFDYIDEKDFKAKKITKKYDLFFGWQGNAFDQLKEYSRPATSETKKQLISTVDTSASIPLLLNHWEMDFNKKVRQAAGLDLPQDLKSMEYYISRLKSQVFIPFFAPGSDDDTLLAYISVYVEAMYGNDFYLEFADEVKSCENLNAFIKSNTQSAVIMKALLDAFKLQAVNEVTLENWTSSTQKDIDAFSQQNQIGVLFTSLLNHRKLDEKTMDRYESERMPVIRSKAVHSLIAPSVCVANLSKKEEAQNIVDFLATGEVQEFLSDETKLAPVNAHAMAYDLQADDVRYLAAIAPAGPVPDIANYCFQTDSTKKAEFASEIRNYLSGSTEK